MKPARINKVDPALMTIKDACRFLALSPAEMYRLMGFKKVEAVKAGKRTLLRFDSLKRWADTLPPAVIKPPKGKTP